MGSNLFDGIIWTMSLDNLPRKASKEEKSSMKMNSNKKTTGMDMKAKLSTLWIFILFNIIFADIHGFLKPGFIAEVMTGTIGGVQLTEGLFLIGAIMMEIPIAMVLLSRVLKYRVNRLANIIAGAIGIVLVIVNGSTAPDRIFFGTIVIVSMLLIIWYAWKWPNPEA